MNHAQNPPAVFNFDNLQVRIINRNSGIWFVAADVCKALGIINPRDAISILDDDEKATVGISDTPLGNTCNIISESGVFILILRSHGALTPGTKAHRFRKWVTAEVLPAIRKSGVYHRPQSAPALPLDTLLSLQRQVMDGLMVAHGTSSYAPLRTLHEHLLEKMDQANGLSIVKPAVSSGRPRGLPRRLVELAPPPPKNVIKKELTPEEEQQALAQVRRFLEQHGESRFSPWQDHANGKPPPINRAGFRKDRQGHPTEYFILPKVFREEICDGLNPRFVAKMLVNKGWLKNRGYNRTSSSHRLPGMGLSRIYHLVVP